MNTLVKKIRNGLVENTYTGSVSIIHHSGKVIFSFGNVEQEVFMRSTIKPLLTLLLLNKNLDKSYKLTESEIAIISGSHNGEPCHTKLIESLLAKLNLDSTFLKCGTHLPFFKEIVENLIENNSKITTLHHNCSGFHAGILLLSHHYGEDLKTYHYSQSTVQEELLALVSILSKIPGNQIHRGMDDCNVPTYGIPLKAIATIYAQLAHLKKQDQYVSKLWSSILNNPVAFAGTGTLETDLIEASAIVLPKIGAGGIYCISIPELEVGISIKLDSDNYQVLETTAMRILLDLGIISQGNTDLIEKYYYQEDRDIYQNKRSYFESCFRIL